MRTKGHVLALHLAVVEALLLSQQNGHAEVCVYETQPGEFEGKMMYDPPTPGAKPLFYIMAAEDKIEDPMTLTPREVRDAVAVDRGSDIVGLLTAREQRMAVSR